MEQPLAIAVEASKNAKTGTVHATYATQASCPSDCALLNQGCYAQSGPIGITTARLNRVAALSKPTPLTIAMAEADAIAKLSGSLDMRIHVVGDCTTSAAASIVSKAAIAKLKTGRRAWTYTHAWKTVDPAAWDGVSVLASTDSLSQVEVAREQGWATAAVVSQFESESVHKQQGVKILPCPNQTRNVKCSDCMLCFDSERLKKTDLTIGFTAHGARQNNVRRVLKTLET